MSASPAMRERSPRARGTSPAEQTRRKMTKKEERSSDEPVKAWREKSRAAREKERKQEERRGRSDKDARDIAGKGARYALSVEEPAIKPVSVQGVKIKGRRREDSVDDAGIAGAGVKDETVSVAATKRALLATKGRSSKSKPDAAADPDSSESKVKVRGGVKQQSAAALPVTGQESLAFARGEPLVGKDVDGKMARKRGGAGSAENGIARPARALAVVAKGGEGKREGRKKACVREESEDGERLRDKLGKTLRERKGRSGVEKYVLEAQEGAAGRKEPERVRLPEIRKQRAVRGPSAAFLEKGS